MSQILSFVTDTEDDLQTPILVERGGVRVGQSILWTQEGY